ncbi:MAG TPA: shikimate kinase [Terriglobales bacterium]|nr:shikimate kinase [Terriglobales bacterium]
MGVRAVFLVGFMASGKTTLGQELARRLNWDFVDLDAHIEARERQTIAEVFRDRGEHEFRILETAALRDLTESLKSDTVVALGGGTFAHPTNRELLRPWSTVFLDSPLDELWERSLEDAAKRPLRKDRTEFARLYECRLPFYRQATVTVVTSGKDLASLCAEIERTLQFRGGSSAAGSSQISPMISRSKEENLQ